MPLKSDREFSCFSTRDLTASNISLTISNEGQFVFYENILKCSSEGVTSGGNVFSVRFVCYGFC